MAPKKEAPRPMEEPEQDDGEEELMEKEIVIGYLKSQLSRLQNNAEKRFVENIRLADELNVQKINLRDINEFLTNELKARSMTNARLKEALQQLKEQIEEIKGKHKEEVEELRQKLDKEMEEMVERLRSMDRKYKSSQEFLQQREELCEQLAANRQELDKLIQQNEQKIGDMERQHVQDKDRWKKELDKRIKDTKAYMMKLTDNQLEMTTKRTIMENEQLSSQLAEQSRKTERLVWKNKAMMAENANIRRKLEMSLSTQTELAKRNNVFQRTIKLLLSKMQLRESRLKSDSREHEELQEMASELQENLEMAHGSLKEKEATIKAQALHMQQARHMMHEAQQQQDKATAEMSLCMEEARRKVVEVETDAGLWEGRGKNLKLLCGKLEDLDAKQRERVLAYLLDKLQIFGRLQREGRMEEVLGLNTAPSGSPLIATKASVPNSQLRSVATMGSTLNGTMRMASLGVQLRDIWDPFCFTSPSGYSHNDSDELQRSVAVQTVGPVALTGGGDATQLRPWQTPPAGAAANSNSSRTLSAWRTGSQRSSSVALVAKT